MEPTPAAVLANLHALLPGSDLAGETLTLPEIRACVRSALAIAAQWTDNGSNPPVSTGCPLPDLADELDNWLPEMASLLFLPNIHPSEQIAFQRGGTDATEKRYTTQSTTYHLVLDELQACFTPANHAAFRNLAVTSALTNALYQLERNGGDPRQAGMEYSVTCRFSEGYTFR